jgi:hypothetical protein
MPTVTSPFGHIKWKEVLEGAIYAGAVPAATMIANTVEAAMTGGELVFNWKLIGISALAGFVSFIVKKILTPSQLRVGGLDANTLADIKTGKKIVKIEEKKVA